jgi:diguanylate cyclase (GGDEF)-like protein
MPIQYPMRLWLRQRIFWLTVAFLILVIGVTATVMSARTVARSNTASDRQQLKATSAQVASTLNLAIQRQRDLVDNTTSLVVAAPGMSNSEFLRANSRRSDRSQSTAISFVSLVPSRRLREFQKRVARDPPPLLPDSTVLPAGRAFYCLFSLSTKPLPGAALPLSLDLCAPTWPKAGLLLKARDTGVGNVSPVPVGKRVFLGFQQPVYRGGVTPKTLNGRRKAMLGWVLMVMYPKALLDRALEGHTRTSATLSYRNAASDLSFTRGSAQRVGRAESIPIAHGWSVQIASTTTARGLLSGNDASVILFAGIGLVSLLSMLVFVLGTSRSRARRMVKLKTGELSHLALHDSLTDLPNRTLVMERAEELIEKAGNSDEDIAALFVDVDGFKQVNDEFGHAAGDTVLKVIGQRLSYVVREQDTVGRLGGDEFVVLLDATDGGGPPEKVAERLVEVLHEPIAIEPGGKLVSVSASVGIATGSRDSADDLLRDADLALYTAKEAGKDQYVLYRAGTEASSSA